MKRPRDINALAAAIVAEATGEDREPGNPHDGKNPAAVELGRRGGLKGGPARAAKLTPEQRSIIASKAARARWGASGRIPGTTEVCVLVLGILGKPSTITEIHEWLLREGDEITRKEVDAAVRAGAMLSLAEPAQPPGAWRLTRRGREIYDTE